MDMHSGGGSKLDWEYIYIEAPQAEAEVIFQSRFGRNPHRVTCTCCGSDYLINEYESLEKATAYERGCAWEGSGYVERADPKRSYMRYQTLDEYLETKGMLFIKADDIKPEERVGELREEGYVWR